MNEMKIKTTELKTNDVICEKDGFAWNVTGVKAEGKKVKVELESMDGKRTVFLKNGMITVLR